MYDYYPLITEVFPILRNIFFINWSDLSRNISDAIHLLIYNYKCINWMFFSENTNALTIEFLEKHVDKINWYNIIMDGLYSVVEPQQHY
jgi:hypothetical protein